MKTLKRMSLALITFWALAGAHAYAQSIDPYDPVPEVPPSSISMQTDGRILLVGNFAEVGSSTLHGVARLDADGSVDPTFNDPGANSEVKTIAVQADGKLLIAGGFTEVGGQPRHSMARLNADGTLDTTFVDPDFNGNAWSIAVQPDGKLLVAGDFTQIGAVTQNYFVRLNADGSYDNSFPDPQFCCNVARTVALEADGHVLIGGYFTQAGGMSHSYLARFSSNGIFDPAFPNTTQTILPSGIVVAPDGSIYVNNVGAILKLSTDGSAAPGFTGAPADSSIDTMMLQPDGRIVIGGIFENVDSQPRHALARLNANGSLDSSFGDLNFSFDAGDANGYIYGIAAQADGRIVAIGNFTLANGQARTYVARVSTGDFATSVLVVTPQASAVTATWYRLGDGPELAQAPILMHSTDGVNFSTVGPMTRVANGWQATANYDVHGARFYLEVLATTSDGAGNASPGQVGSGIYSSDTIFADGFE